jgi:hypothetical protein
MEASAGPSTGRVSTNNPSSRSEVARGDFTAGDEPGPIRRLLLATDLSSASELATDEAIGLAVQHDAQLIVLSVIDPGRLRLPGGQFLRRIDQERARVGCAAGR